MNPDAFEHSDAAYVMGILSADEIREFEAHLATCPACEERVAELRTTVGSLALAPEWAFADDAPAAVPDAGPVPDLLLPRLLAQTRRSRRRQRITAVSSMLVAAAAVIGLLVAVFTNQTPDATTPSRQAATMANLLSVPLVAKADVVNYDAGTRVDMWCRYEAGDTSDGSYVLQALTRNSGTVVLGTWPGIPGRTAVMHISTQLKRSDIICIEIVGWSGKVVSRLTL